MKYIVIAVVVFVIGWGGLLPCAYSAPIKLLAGVYTGAEPLYMYEKQNGKVEISGMNREIVTAFLQKAQEFQISFLGNLPAPRAFEYLKDNTVQVIFGIAKDAERETLYQYTDTPLYPVKFCIIARADDIVVHRIFTYEAMKQVGGTVLGLRGSTAIKVFEERTKDLNIPIEVTTTLEQNFKKLMAHRGRFFVFNNYTLIEGVKQLGYQSQVVMLPLVVHETSHWVAFSKAVPPEVVQKANAVLRELQDSGELQRICARYGNLP